MLTRVPPLICLALGLLTASCERSEAPPPVDPRPPACTDHATLPGRAVAIACREVTVADYRRCVAAGACSEPRPHRADHEVDHRLTWGALGREDHPVNGVTHAAAATYCAWTGGRLPTEAEWQVAAQGEDSGRAYPWGADPPERAGAIVANVADDQAALRYGWTAVPPGYDDGHAATAPVGSYPAGRSPLGVVDLAGNVWEWTATMAGDADAVIRGGGYANHGWALRADRGDTTARDTAAPWLGFRCVRERYPNLR